MTNPTPHGQVPAIQRYKIGYHSDEWGQRSSTPSGIPDASGSWVRYEDHAAELRRLHAYCQELESHLILDCMTHVQNPAEIEHVAGDVSKNGAELNMTGSAMRASHGQAPAQAAPAAVAGPVVNRATVIEWLDANDIEVTDRQMDGLFHFAAPTTQPSPAAQEDALDAAFEAVRKRLCKLPRYSFALDSRGNIRRCEEKSGNWIEFDAAHALFDPVVIDATIAAQGGK